MKPRKFKPGDKVTPKPADKGRKWLSETGSKRGAPSLGEIYTTGSDADFFEGEWYVDLVEMPLDCCYSEDYLEKVVSDSVLEAELETIKMPELV